MTGWETLALQDAEWTEHDKPSKRYDEFGKTLDKFYNMIPKSKSRFKKIKKV